MAKQLLLAAFLLSSRALYAQPEQENIKIIIDDTRTYQTMHNFGASDAWACQFVGNWPADKKNRMADWLFSMDTTANGQPKGIGLSMWRFNLGAGSSQQGNASGIKDEWRRAESFLEADGRYNWSRQAAQRWFLDAAKRRGVPYFLAFLNSPPVQFTNNRKAYADSGRCNIDSSQYNAMATYAAKSIKGLQEKAGIVFNYISPVNEPQWDWSDGGQEGCPYSNQQVAGFVKTLSDALQRERLQASILIPEAGNIKYLLADDDKPGRGNQVNDLMSPDGSAYIGNVPSVAPVIAGHSYFSTAPYNESVTLRRQLAERVAGVNGLSFWQSEYCILGDNKGEIDGNKRDTGMTAALYVARTIHTDLVVANATAWQWWLAISPYDYKDGLIYIDKNKTDGNFQDSKILWALGNYSRFIRPGTQRIEASLSKANDQLFVSAWKKDKQTVVVIVNTGSEGKAVDMGNKRMETYTTSATQALSKQYVSGPVHIGPESIVTVVM